jgi:hypothetical protein
VLSFGEWSRDRKEEVAWAGAQRRRPRENGPVTLKNKGKGKWVMGRSQKKERGPYEND